MHPDIVKVELETVPNFVRNLFQYFKKAGLSHVVIFGGAIRDIDCSSAWKHEIPVKDYDIRIWSELDETFVADKIASALHVPYQVVKSKGTQRVRYQFQFLGVELDVSIRLPQTKEGVDTVSLMVEDRVMDADAALSSIVMTPSLECFARKEYLTDRDQKILTFYYTGNEERLASYLKRMTKKFSQCREYRILRKT